MSDAKLSEIAQRLWDLNENKLVRNVHYKLNLISERNKNDKDKPLFAELDTKHVLKQPTFKTFIKLLDNYTAETGQAEVVTKEEEREEEQFIDACMRTPVMQEAHRFLIEQKKAPRSEPEFKRMLDLIWFDCYSRSANERVEDSSAFEHVFVGELRQQDSTALGLHNWINFYLLEKSGKVDYHGSIRSQTIYDLKDQSNDPGVLAISYSFNGVRKPLGGFMVGTSPEFELALYTVVFLCGQQKNKIEFGNIRLGIECHRMQREGRSVIATMYPTL